MRVDSVQVQILKDRLMQLITATVIVCLLMPIAVLNVLDVQADQVEVLQRIRYQTVQGTDGLWYVQCLEGCELFYDIAPIDDLYQPQETDWEAWNYFGALEAAYFGLAFTPLPAPSDN